MVIVSGSVVAAAEIEAMRDQLSEEIEHGKYLDGGNGGNEPEGTQREDCNEDDDGEEEETVEDLEPEAEGRFGTHLLDG